MSKLIKRLNGFSLMEALVATAILALTLVALLGVFPFALKVNKLAERTTMSSNYAKTKLEEILIKSYDEVSVGIIESRHHLSTNPEDSAYYIERETVVSLIDGNLMPSAVDVGLKKIKVTIWWTEPGGVNYLEFYSILSQK